MFISIAISLIVMQWFSHKISSTNAVISVIMTQCTFPGHENLQQFVSGSWISGPTCRVVFHSYIKRCIWPTFLYRFLLVLTPPNPNRRSHLLFGARMQESRHFQKLIISASNARRRCVLTCCYQRTSNCNIKSGLFHITNFTHVHFFQYSFQWPL